MDVGRAFKSHLSTLRGQSFDLREIDENMGTISWADIVPILQSMYCTSNAIPRGLRVSSRCHNAQICTAGFKVKYLEEAPRLAYFSKSMLIHNFKLTWF